MQSSNSKKAGGIVFRKYSNAQDYDILLVHRPRYDDWTFPKGHCEKGESLEETALREVLEETGLSCTIIQSLPLMSYITPKGKFMSVAYFFMEPQNDEQSPHDKEVDVVKWFSCDDGMARLTYQSEKDFFLYVRSGIHT